MIIATLYLFKNKFTQKIFETRNIENSNLVSTPVFHEKDIEIVANIFLRLKEEELQLTPDMKKKYDKILQFSNNYNINNVYGLSPNGSIIPNWNRR